jgi:hypothetical protein
MTSMWGLTRTVGVPVIAGAPTVSVARCGHRAVPGATYGALTSGNGQ